MNIACVLVSWRPNEPAGMERAVAGLATGLRARGHRVLIITAAPQPAHRDLVRLRTLTVSFPTDDTILRAAITAAESDLRSELASILRANAVDIVYFVDALWGLGRLDPTGLPARRVLGVHVLGDDLPAAMAHAPHAIITPAHRVLSDAASTGIDTHGWTIVPNSLLLTDPPVPGSDDREELRRTGPVSVLARLGAEKGIDNALTAADGLGRPVRLTLAAAAFEPHLGDQARLLDNYRALAQARPNVTIHPGLPWAAVPGWLAGAAVVLVPSVRETFGLVALEALSVGTPVIAYAVGNLPDLIGDAGTLVPPTAGPDGLRVAIIRLLTDPVTYRRASQAAWRRARDYHPEAIAHHWLEATRR